jgi:hypothetical protein
MALLGVGVVLTGVGPALGFGVVMHPVLGGFEIR